MVAVGHNEFRSMQPQDLKALVCQSKPVLGDIKYGNRKMNERTGTRTQALCAVRISFLDIPEENTLHYLTGKVIKLKDPQIVKQFDALDKNKEGATSWQT